MRPMVTYSRHKVPTEWWLGWHRLAPPPQWLGRWSMIGELSPIYAWSMVDFVSKCPLWVNQPGQLSLPGSLQAESGRPCLRMIVLLQVKVRGREHGLWPVPCTSPYIYDTSTSMTANVDDVNKHPQSSPDTSLSNNNNNNNNNNKSPK